MVSKNVLVREIAKSTLAAVDSLASKVESSKVGCASSRKETVTSTWNENEHGVWAITMLNVTYTKINQNNNRSEITKSYEHVPTVKAIDQVQDNSEKAQNNNEHTHILQPAFVEEI